MNRPNKYLSLSYIVFVIAFAFFSLFVWKHLKLDIGFKPFPKLIFYYLTIGIPSLGLLVWKFFKSEKPYNLTITDLFFFLFILWSIASIGFSINSAYAINGAIFRINLLLVFVNLKWIFQEYPNRFDLTIANILLLFGFIFIGNYFFNNVEALLELLNENGNYQKVVRKLPSLLGTKNVTAMFLMLVFMLHFALSGVVKKIKWVHILFQFLAVFMLLVLGSRNVYCSLVIFGLLLFFLGSGNLKTKMIKRIALFSCAIFLFLFLVNGDKFINHLKYNTFSSRVKMWYKAGEVIKENPIVGQGTYQYLIYKPFFNVGNHGHPHNDFVRTTMEHGLIGLVIWLVLLLWPIVYGIKLLRNTKKEEFDYQLLGLVIAAISYISISNLDGLQYKISHQVIFMIIFAKLDVGVSQKISKKITNNWRYSGNMVVGFGVLFGLTNLVYGQQFLNNYKIHNNAMRLIKQKKNNQAIGRLNSINTTYYFERSRNPVYTEVGIMHLKKKQLSNAGQNLKKSLMQYPHNYKTLKELHQVLDMQNKQKEASSYLAILFKMNYYEAERYLEKLQPETAEKYKHLLVKKRRINHLMRPKK